MHWNDYPHFTANEFCCDCGCGRVDMDAEFVAKLQALRHLAGFPLPVCSGFRCPAHNAAVSSTGRDGPHTTGKAADIRLSGARARQLLALAGDFTGIGIAQKGPQERRFIHLDTLTTGPRPWIWSY